jgi:NAD-dependent deacetylase
MPAATTSEIADWLATAASPVAFTGAGISTESGIPDFRSPGGVWSKYQPVYFDDFLQSPAARHEYWRQKCEAHNDFAAARPNVAHQVLAKWEHAGRLAGVITQNIDGLHQLAGSRTVLELHGTARQIACLDCDARFAVEPLVRQFLETDAVPQCPSCRGRLKHATISFGQPLPEDVLSRAGELARESDIFLAIGSSLVVQPAAALPVLAKRSGARLIIVNREKTPLDELADAVIRAPIGETLAQIDRAVTPLA